MKTCSRCGNGKMEAEFYPRYNQCKACTKYVNAATGKIWRANNKDRENQNARNWKSKNKAKISERSRTSYALNRNHHAMYALLRRLAFPDQFESYRIKYRPKRNVQKNLRYRTDPQYNLRIKVSRRIKAALRNSFSNNSKKTIPLLGCSATEFKEYIESKFSTDMKWENVLSGVIHIDHKRPVASFNLLDPEQQKQCFHYTNLQPLWAKDNLMKSDKFLPEEPLEVAA